MARTLNSPVTAQRGDLAYLYEINHSGGTLRLTNANEDVSALAQTWTAVGGRLVQGEVSENSDQRAQGVELELYGLDQTITNAIQANNFRGHVLRIWLIHWDPDTGVQGTPDRIFVGRQNGDFRVSETRGDDGGSVSVRTRITADLASINEKVSVRCNVASHEEFLRRSGVGSPDDKFFDRVRTIMGKDVWWGRYPERGADHTGVGPDRGEDGEIQW